MYLFLILIILHFFISSCFIMIFPQKNYLTFSHIFIPLSLFLSVTLSLLVFLLHCSSGMPQLMVQDAEKQGRRKVLSGTKEYNSEFLTWLLNFYWSLLSLDFIFLSYYFICQIPPSACLPVYLPIRLSVYLFVNLSVYLFICVCLSLCLSISHILLLSSSSGKESGPTVTAVESTSTSNAVSERDAMALLTRFQFPSKRWWVS